ncbi:hypothetical protein P886_1666 [Alteromonadaceae bacterium 2753L.S.0a.02]|nr:hypothetical protein P886_1666 [Alteromonadaceae bacterium 2753L.S.0a.02]
MNKLLNAGILFLPVPFIVRFGIISGSEVPFFQIATFQTWEKIVYLICLLLACTAFWNLFFRRRCPLCKQFDYRLTGSEEVDRWVGTKRVRERLDDKRSVMRTVSTTFVKIKNAYHCEKCQHDWTELVKRELR